MESIENSNDARPDKVTKGVTLKPRRLLFVADLLSACLAALVMYLVFQLRGIHSGQAQITAIMAALIIVVTLALLMRSGQYANRRRIAPFSDMGIVARDMIISGAAVTLVSYLTKGFFTGNTTPSRLGVGSFVLAFFVFSAASRVCLNAYQRYLFGRGRAVNKILVLGTGAAAVDFLQFVQNRPWLGVVVAGRVAYSPQETSTSGDEWPSGNLPGDAPGAELPVVHLTNSLEGLGRLDQILRASGASEVVVALESSDQVQLPQVASLLSLAHVPFKVIPSLFEQSYRATELLGYAEIPVINVEVDAFDRVARLFKRAMDVCVAVAAFLLLIPLEVLIVVAIAAESGLPIIYRQERVGKNGRRFLMYKFRTMSKDADQHLKELEARNEAGADGRLFKIHHDPRVTRVGAVLRKFSLDELPQLINVLKREMSMVGPRPPLPAEVERYEQEHLHRLKALPGMTGLWQVSGRSDLGFDDMVKLDRYYLDHWSLRLDAGILLRTLLVVVRGKGAY